MQDVFHHARVAHAARRTLRRLVQLVACVLLCAAAPAWAQLLDTVEVSRDGPNVLVRIRFAVFIQYLRHAPTSRGETVQVFFQITAGGEEAATVLEEQRRSPPNDLLPRFDVTYPTQAPGVQRRIEIRFAEPVDFRLRPEDSRTILLTIPLSEERLAKLAPPKPAGVAPPPPATAVEPTTDLDKEAAPLMNAARDALASGDFEAAALALNRVLNLPPNAFSQDAQELIGLARERLGETAKAKAEYELYLKLYPDGPGAARVRARVAELSVAPVVGRAPAPPPPLRTAWGSLSQYYYGGNSQVDTTTITVSPATNATTIDTSRLTSTDQSQLVTNVDATGRWREGPWDTRLVVRDSFAWNFLADGDNRNRLTALFAETRYAPENLFARVGRQTVTSGGVIGRFDGAVGSWGPRPDLRLNGVVGSPVDTIQGLTKIFAGGSLDIENVLPRTSLNLFGIGQRVEGDTDRIGVGAEVRYFDNERMIYALVDYDPSFGAVNIAMAQGSWQFPTGTSVNLLADYRRAPTLQLTNALFGAPNVEFETLVQTLGIDATRDLAKAFTPTSKVYLVGLTQQMNPQWQLGFDFRISSLSGTPATATMPAQPGTGNVYTYTLQAIGTSLTPWRDILVANGSVLRGRFLDGWQVGFDYRFSPWEPLTIEPMYRYYSQKDSLATTLTRHLPGLRIIYLVRARLSLEGEYAMEKSRTTGAIVTDDSTRNFWYVGWRWDF